MNDFSNVRLAIVGLGYVGLPLAVEFGKKYSTIGFDINKDRIDALRNGIDTTLEVQSEELLSTEFLSFSTQLEDLQLCNIYVVTVPTPIDQYKQPDLTPLIRASESIGEVLSNGDIVIYESTVYPGATEEVCVPILEKISGLIFNKDFYAGYSPERINPGDKHHRLPSIKKVTSGSTPEIGVFLNELYGTIITAGTHLAPSIKVAEAAKVIENTQRDLNIALINELAVIFERLDIDTLEVLEAAGTKWNFLSFKPGLVGGHCIGVDPYYLTHKAQAVGYHPEVVLAGRRINDGMGSYVATKFVRELINRDQKIKGARVLILGLTFKEDCPDIRNTRVIDVIAELEEFGMKVDVADPWVDVDVVVTEMGINVVEPESGIYDGILILVAHSQFREMGADAIRHFGKAGAYLYDIKGIFDRQLVDGRL